MNTEQMHNTLLHGEDNQREFIEQIGLLLKTKVYLEGIIINARSLQFESLRKYIASDIGLNQAIPVIAALLLPKPDVRAMLLAILAEETVIEAEKEGKTVKQLNRKYKSSKDETKAQKDMQENPDIHKAALAGIPLTTSQKAEIRKRNKPESDPMTFIRYPSGDLKAGLEALVKKHSADELENLSKLVDEVLVEA